MTREGDRVGEVAEAAFDEATFGALLVAAIAWAGLAVLAATGTGVGDGGRVAAVAFGVGGLAVAGGRVTLRLAAGRAATRARDAWLRDAFGGDPDAGGHELP